MTKNLTIEAKRWVVYIVKCADDTLYTGITTDLQKRLDAHNGVIKGGAKYTQFKRPVASIHQEYFENRSEASKREYQIKQLSRAEKLLLK